MSIDLVTGYAGSSHITAEKVRLGNCGIVGNADYVLNTGNKFAATIVTNNKVSIASGDAMMQGAHISIAPGSTEDAIIANCTAGQLRNDIICLQYSKNTSTGIETASVVVVKGVAGSTATDPVVTTGDLSSGDTLHQMPLYRVKISGLTITAVETVFSELSHLADMNDEIELRPKKTYVDARTSDYIVEQGTSGIWAYRKWNIGKFDMCGYFDNASSGMTINLPFAVIELYGSFVCGHYNTSTSVASFYSFDFNSGATSGTLHAFDPSGSERTISTLSGHIYIYGRYK